MGQFLPKRTVKKCLIIAFFIFSTTQITTAQHRLGLANSNYGGVTNLMSNPADIAGSRYKTYIGLGQTDLHLTNNYFKFPTLASIVSDSIKFLTNNGDYLSVGFDFAGLSWIQSINSKGTFALSSRQRGAFQAVGITRNLYSKFGEYLTTNVDQPTDIKGAGINLGGQIFSELALSYAHTLVDNGETGLKLGATVKRLTGAFSTGLSLSQIDAVYTKTPSIENYKVTNGQLNIAYVGSSAFDSLTSTSPADLFKGNGSGWGFDVGATYELRSGFFSEDDGTTPYKVRIGVAVTDLGSIKYSGSNVRYYTKDLKNATINVTDTSGLGSSDDLLKSAGINADSFSTSFYTQIPTMLRINADVRLAKHFFVNAYLAHSIASTYKLGTQYASYIAVTPRLETRYFDASLPLALTNNYKTFAMGIGFRAGPVTFGMDNFTGFFGSASGFNAHAGLNIGFGRRKNHQELTDAEKEKQKEAEVAEAKNESKEKARKRSKKMPKDDPLSNEPMQKPEVVAAPRSIERVVVPMPESEPVKTDMKAKQDAPKMAEKQQNMPAKTAPTVVTAPKPSAPTTTTKPQEMPAKSAPTVANAPKPNTPTTTAKPQEMPTKSAPTVANAPKPSAPTTSAKPQEMPTKSAPMVNAAPKPSVPTTNVKPKEMATKTAPLSTTPPKAPAVVVAPKPSVPTAVEKPAPIVLSPVGSGKMGECIEFYPNKAAISGNSLACLREISKFLLANRSIKLNVAGNISDTDKVADATALKTERAKTIRNFLIQSGVEAARLTIKLSDSANAAPIVLTPQ